MTKKITDFFALEGNYPDLDAEGAVARLSQAIHVFQNRDKRRKSADVELDYVSAK